MALAILDALAHLSPLLRSSLSSFRALDIVIGAQSDPVYFSELNRYYTGATSFIPILLFTFSLYLFKRREFFPDFPERFIFVAHLFATLSIPAILITNEIGSFIGDSYSALPIFTN